MVLIRIAMQKQSGYRIYVVVRLAQLSREGARMTGRQGCLQESGCALCRHGYIWHTVYVRQVIDPGVAARAT